MTATLLKLRRVQRVSMTLEVTGRFSWLHNTWPLRPLASNVLVHLRLRTLSTRCLCLPIPSAGGTGTPGLEPWHPGECRGISRTRRNPALVSSPHGVFIRDGPLW